MRRYENDFGSRPDAGSTHDELDGGDAWTRELEAKGRTVAFFLLIPVLLVALLLAGCGDSNRDRTTDSDDAKASGVETSIRSNAAPPTEPVKRPRPPTSSDSDSSGREGEPGDVEAGVSEGPVSFASAEEAYHEGQFDRALEMFTTYGEDHPENPWGDYMMGLSAWKAGDLDRAEKALEETVRKDSSHVKGWVNLVRVRLDDERPEDARAAVIPALELAPEQGDVYRVLGRVAQEEGELDEAEEAYRKALVRDGEDAWSMNNLALIHIHRGDFEAALPPMAKAVQIRADVPVFQNNLGTALEKAGRFTAASQAYRKADEGSDGYEKARTSLARVEALQEPAELEPVDLEELARGFTDTIDGWTEERMAATDGDAEVDPDAGSPKPSEREVTDVPDEAEDSPEAEAGDETRSRTATETENEEARTGTETEMEIGKEEVVTSGGSTAEPR